MGDPLTAPDGFRVDVATVATTGVVSIAGDLDLRSCRRLREELTGLIEDGVTSVVIDLAHMDFVDSTGLDVLVGAQKRLRQRGGEVVLRSPRPAAR